MIKTYLALFIPTIAMMVAICSFSFYAVAEEVNSEALYAQPISLLNGQTLNLQSYVGQKPVYLKFWASWCQPCMQEMPHLQHAYEKYAEQIEIIAVNVNINETQQDIAAVIQRFDLTLPIALDHDSALTYHYKMLGTPYHVLLNKQGKVVHSGHQANNKLDHKLQLLAADNGANIATTPLTDNSGHTTQLADIKQTDGLVFFTATWCDWYLAETRSEMSKACIEGQQEINRLQQAMPHLHWYGILNHLWTSEEDLDAYSKKYQIKYPVAVDNGGDAFFSYGVHAFPSLIIFKDGVERYRTADIVNNSQLLAAIQQWLMP
ncbi:TlpA family protein disulfide reductase [Paraglaciecola hydrolytica]|uniref:Thioredoxin domain-containing protein n=1 Tax=Paraglaciecola hydrolytica TaxID=1799789 RepID=A0A136A524_9ALTE|nr:redoxin domain-containing protein [Paraglaciecola hydrolytica]KXI30333.1 hypothetical protein AX660_10170 [Paraglaciecola hydrolytica]